MAEPHTPFDWRTNIYGFPDSDLYYKNLRVGGILRGRHAKPWFAVIMTSEDGREIGSFDSADEAKAGLVAAVRELVG